MLVLHLLSWSSGESVSLLILTLQIRPLCLDHFCSFSQLSPLLLGNSVEGSLLVFGSLPPFQKITMKGFLLDT